MHRTLWREIGKEVAQVYYCYSLQCYRKPEFSFTVENGRTHFSTSFGLYVFRSLAAAVHAATCDESDFVAKKCLFTREIARILKLVDLTPRIQQLKKIIVDFSRTKLKIKTRCRCRRVVGTININIVYQNSRHR